MRRVSGGSSVVFLHLGMLGDGRQAMRWAPIEPKGTIAAIDVVGGFYRKDDWAKDHPIFAGLPAGGIMDYSFYREIIPLTVMTGVPAPAEAVCGAIRSSGGVEANSYGSGLHIAVYKLGAGRVILNNLKVRENLGKDPAAERLLRNMLNYAATNPSTSGTKCPPSRAAHGRGTVRLATGSALLELNRAFRYFSVIELEPQVKSRR
jgi:hypothetical protein